MMKTKFKICLCLLLVCTGFYAFRLADDPFEVLMEKLNSFNADHPQEKVHLHLDKPYYAIGDNIWLKAYVTDAASGKLTDISSSVYVELINENDSVTKQLKLPLTSGLGFGDFKLTDTLKEGNYRIRAYTQWMRNLGPDYFFDKTIQIGNAWANKVFTRTSYSITRKNDAEQLNARLQFSDKQQKPYSGQAVSYQVWLKDKIVDRGRGTTTADGTLNINLPNKADISSAGRIVATITLANKQEIVKTIPIRTNSGILAVQLFPEGGNLVENLPSKVGVKVINTGGTGESVTGTLIDNDGVEMLTFSTNQFGMGHFIINPQPGKIYTAFIKKKDGNTQSVALPKVLPSGYVLAVNNTDSTKINAKLFISESLLNQGEVKLVVQSGNTVLSVLKSTARKQVTSLSLPKKDLPSGIIHFTVFNTVNQPVCERLIFINNPADLIDIELSDLKSSYGRRENVALKLNAKDDNKPTIGSFSVAVTNSAIVEPDPDRETNILTSLLLSSDLKGYIEKPNYYFNHKDSKTAEDLDNLMLTQGWSRFLWTDMATYVKKAPVYPVEKMQRISGTITNLGGKPVAQGKVSLLSTSGGLFMIDTLTDANGKFSFDNLAFGDSTRFVVQARNAKNKKNTEINLDIVPGQVVTKNKNTGDIVVNVNEAIQSYVQKSEGYFDELAKRGLLERSFLLDQVNIVQKKNPAKNSSNLNGAGNADAVIQAKDLTTSISLSQYLQGRVAGLIIRNGQAYLMRNGNTPMTIVLDGMNVGPDFLDNIIPQDVETIEVLKSISNTAIYGSQGAGGVLVITTKRGGGDMSYSRYSPGIITTAPKGYYAERQFYSPQYTPGNTIAGEDRRTTVYWNPYLLSKADGIAQFNFYNTDQPGLYRIVIEGINDEGHLARKVYTYEVK
jgi:TonB-dependent SusC/RagA subfamily outer membrane receptor